MSDEEKKNGDYEKPESQKMGGDDLQDVSGGAGAGTGQESECRAGGDTKTMCEAGVTAPSGCLIGDEGPGIPCQNGSHPGWAPCRTGESAA